MRTHNQIGPRFAMVSALTIASLSACAPSVAQPDGSTEASVLSDASTLVDSSAADGSTHTPDGANGTSEAGAATFASRVVEFTAGEGAGFGQSRMPDIVLGRPEGTGDMRGSTHVVSLGRGGRICLEMAAPITDGPGADFIVFENAFIIAGTPDTYRELGEVSVSEDGARFVTFTCDTRAPYRDCAGVNPVYASSMNTLDATDPRYAGGDAFDLATVGLSRARVVCVRDLATQELSPPSTGFDLDAIAAVHVQR